MQGTINLQSVRWKCLLYPQLFFLSCHFSRVRDLLRAGVIKESKKPVWFDVYAAFPPTREPVYVKPVRLVRQKTEENVSEIFYKEDQIRA